MITVAYITMREENCFQWFWKGLLNQKKQFPDIAMQFIYVDYWKDYRVVDLSNECGIETLHVNPLPSVWQGKYRQSKNIWYACANARNTPFVYAIHPHIAFCDDLTVLGERWLEGVIDSAKGGYIGLGAYNKSHDMIVEEGKLISCRTEAQGIDSRLSIYNSEQTKVNGDSLYGCSLCMPLEAGLSVNGFDCLTDSIGYEDQVFGIRLQKKGYSFIYDKRMFTHESEDHLNQFHVKRNDPLLTKDQYNDVLKKFGIEKSCYPVDARKDCSHIIVEASKLNDPKAIWNFFSLRELRAKHERGEEITLSDMNYPLRTWWDNTEIKEL